MQQLKRIILIDTATVPYQEIMLDGNIHFIGTQGVGKSTVLRAILFFYIADTRKLGLSKEQKSFAEYYFPHINSYILYEVEKDDRLFTVWLLKKQNRLTFRFIDEGYNKDYFIENNKILHEEEIIERLTKNNIQVGKPITNYTEYRDMLYGAKRKNLRYSLLESKTYQNIPRTISNIFMNSSLDASFIKKTIINSLSDEPYFIDLETYRHHIQTAGKNYYDIVKYKKHHNKVLNILKQYDAFLAIQDNIISTAWQLGASYNFSKSCNIELEEQIITQKKELAEIEEKFNKVQSNVSNELQTLRNKLAVEKNNLKKAREVDKKYKELEIDKILEEYNKKDSYINQKQQLEDQLNALTTKSGSIKSEYDNQLKNIDLNTRDANQKLEKQIAEEKEAFYSSKDQITEQFEQRKSEIQQEKKEIIDELNNKINQHQREIDQLNEQEKYLKEKEFFKSELTNLSSQIQEANKQQYKLNHELEQLAQKKNTEELKAKQQENDLEAKFAKDIENHKNRINELTDRENSLSSQLQKYKETFLDYLEQNKPAWRHDIGKVVDDQILLNTQLEPKKREGKSLYGIEINTDKLEPTLLSEQYLKEQLNNAQDQRKKFTRELEKIYQNKEEELKKLQKKINKTFRDLKNEEEQKKYRLSQSGVKLENLNNQWKNLKEEADKEKEKAIKNIKDKIAEKENSLDQIKNKKKDENEYFQNSLADIEKQKTEQISSRKKQRDKAIKNIRKQIDENNKAAEQEKEKITQNRNKALKEKGIDTNTIDDLENRINKLQEKLDFIDKNTQIVFEYRKDQKDYLLQMETFKNSKDQLEAKIKKRESRWKEREKEFYEQINQVKNKKQEIEKQREFHQKQVEWLDQKFKKDSIYQEFKNYIENNDKYEKEDVETLIDKIRQQKNEENEKANKLRERMANFAGFFDEDNTLQLPVMVQTHNDSIQFAEFLKDIEDNQKITDMELDVTKKYAMMINNIGKDTDELFKKREEIEKVVSKMNTDFRNSNFVGVVRSIELRLQQGTDPIIHTLRDIQEFRSDNMLTIGENNLFAQDNENSGNIKAVELLEELDKRISNHKERYVGIEDAFELEFRIRENENDTGWVSRLSNVGSHGTDILVKSMIYINLLNIFKKRESRNKSSTKIHCLIDEVGILHDTNVRGLINFAAERDIYLINSSPNSHNEEDYKHIYQFNKDHETNKTNVFKLLSQTI